MQNVIDYRNMKDSKKHYTKKEMEARKTAGESIKTKPLRKRPPDWLNEEAKKEWKKIIKDISDFDLFTSADENLICTYCITMAQYKRSVLNCIIDDSMKLSKILITLSDKLGLSPNGRARLAVKKVNEEKDEIEEKFGI